MGGSESESTSAVRSCGEYSLVKLTRFAPSFLETRARALLKERYSDRAVAGSSLADEGAIWCRERVPAEKDDDEDDGVQSGCRATTRPCRPRTRSRGMTTTTGSPPATATASDDLLLAESLVSLSLNTTTNAVARSTPRTQARTAVLFQPACTKHRYIRTRDTSTIVERPERIRAVKTGVAAAYARLETALPAARHDDDDDDLDALLSGLSLDANRDLKGKRRARELVDPRGPFDILDSGAVMSVHDPALEYIHSKPSRAPQDVDAAAAQEDQGWESASSSSSAAIPSTSAGPSASAMDPKPPRANTRPVPWPEQLQSLCRASSSLLSSQPSLAPSSSSRSSEIPSHLPQGDLYLCPGSEEAIFGALGACCEGVDRIVRGSRESGAGHASAQGSDSSVGLYDRAFVAIRPPGHVSRGPRDPIRVEAEGMPDLGCESVPLSTAEKRTRKAFVSSTMSRWLPLTVRSCAPRQSRVSPRLT